MNRNESLAILFSTILAVEGWLFTHLSEHLGTSPILEYRVELTSDAQGKKAIYQLQNLSRSMSYKDISIRLTAPPGSSLLGSAAIPVEPAWEGDEQPIDTPNASTINIPNLMPWAKIRIEARYSGNRPFIRIASPTQAMLSSKPTFETFIARNQSAIMALMIPLTLLAGGLVVLIGNNVQRRRVRK